VKLRHQLAKVLHHLHLPLPDRISSRVERVMASLAADKTVNDLFGRAEVVSIGDGVWQVHPLPSQDQLATYYSTMYWATRSDITTLLKHRDIGQYQCLKPYLDTTSQTHSRRALNFGSGHGGVSHLLSAAGYSTTNVDMYDAKIPNCLHLLQLDKFQGTCSVFFASHSLEHVRSLTEIWDFVSNHLDSDGVIFVEVPNSEYRAYSIRSGNGYRPKIQPPHTYYLTKRYFETLPLEILELGIYSYVTPYGQRVESVDDGEVIRFIARLPSR
jgi:hypothetical protein